MTSFKDSLKRTKDFERRELNKFYLQTLNKFKQDITSWIPLYTYLEDKKLFRFSISINTTKKYNGEKYDAEHLKSSIAFKFFKSWLYKNTDFVACDVDGIGGFCHGNGSTSYTFYLFCSLEDKNLKIEPFMNRRPQIK
ncbi:hypothetical protein ACFX5K_03760 [Rickettsiales bacterium LUAb2]